MTPPFSVVVPAHDEAAVVQRCLEAFLPWPGPEAPEVVVVANGCTDDTVDRARAVPGVTVLDLAEPAKHGALNAGDAAVTVWPRVYLDADVVLDAPSLRALVETLRTDRAVAAAPQIRFVLEGRPWAVRAFYRVFSALPYVSDGLVGLGVVGVSAAGRARWAEFPSITADDLFVQRLFAPEERVVVRSAHFDVQTPRTLSGLVRVRTRTAQGNAELADHGQEQDATARTTASSSRALLGLLARRPTLLPSALVYAGVTAVSRRRAARSAVTWHRDDTTR